MPQARELLNENQVIKAVVSFLQAHRFQGIRTSTTHQHGVDIKAGFPDGNGELWIEAKGATSSKPGTSRFELGFSGSQSRDHMANAVYTALRYVSLPSSERPRLSGIALPVEQRATLVEPVLPVLSRLGVVVFLVSKDRTVEILGKFA